MDRYYTPTAQVRAVEVLLEHLPLGPGLSILEPCAGTGNIARVLRAHGHGVTTADIDPGVQQLVDMRADAMRYPYPVDGYDGVITNPPFRGASSLVRRLLPVGRVFSAHLLRVTFLEPCRDRLDLLGVDGRGALYKVIVMSRMSFTDNGRTDSATTAWFIWRRHWVGTPQLVVEDLRAPIREAQPDMWGTS
jgi:hypothetical protein